MILEDILAARIEGRKLLAILIDPDKFVAEKAADFLLKIPKATTHILVGGSSVPEGLTEIVVKAIKQETALPVILFPGDVSQITEEADGILFLSLISGRNPEYLIGQQVKSAPRLQGSSLEVIPTGYLLIDGGKSTAVQQISGTRPIFQTEIETIVNTCLAGQFLGKKLLYLEAGSGAEFPVAGVVIAAVKEAVELPLIVGGGIRSIEQLRAAYSAGADMVVVGTAFENGEGLR